MAKVRLITEPFVTLIAAMALKLEGVNKMIDWVATTRPECLPDDLPTDRVQRAGALFPHDSHGEHVTPEVIESGKHEPGAPRHFLTGNEMLVELAGRTCYHSYGLKAGKKSNAGYLANMMSKPSRLNVAAAKQEFERAWKENDEVDSRKFMEPPQLGHLSVFYHAKMSFFIANISRRVSHELIRHYVGADRTEEGSPSQESTRYTTHPGTFVVHPNVLEIEDEEHRKQELYRFERDCQEAYNGYLNFIDRQVAEHGGAKVDTSTKKKIHEAAAQLLPMAATTSMVWTTNPVALAKLFGERCSPFADGEFRRFARVWRDVAHAAAPNLFTETNPEAK